MKTLSSVFFALLLVAGTSACAPEVGSEKWCANMKEKPKGEWTMDETKEYGKNCLLYLWHRETGEPIHPMVETAVPTETDVPGHGDGGSSDPTKSRYDTHVVLPTGKPPPLLKTTVACVGAHALCWTATTPSPSVATHEMATRSDTNQLTALRITPTVRQAHHPAGRHRERDQPTTAVSLAPGQGFWIQDIHFLATKEDSHDA